MKPNILLAFTVLGSAYAGAMVTLLEVVPTGTITAVANEPSVIQAGTTEVQVIGTGADGKTTYVQQNIVSYYALVYPLPDDPAATGTTTLISEAQTLAVTFAEDKDGYHATRSVSVAPSGSPLSYQGGLDEQCSFYSNSTGSCVRVIIGVDAATKPILSTTTYNGRLNAWYTLSSTLSSQPSQTAFSNAIGMQRHGFSSMMISTIIVTSSVLGLLVPLV